MDIVTCFKRHHLDVTLLASCFQESGSQRQQFVNTLVTMYIPLYTFRNFKNCSVKTYRCC